MSGMANIENALQLGGGAQFWAYISPQNDTNKNVTAWEVRIEQGDWIGVLSSVTPTKTLQAKDRSGVFKVTVTASGPSFGRKVLSPLPDTKPDVGCNENCAAMIGIVASPSGTDASYWTVWDAICSRSG